MLLKSKLIFVFVSILIIVGIGYKYFFIEEELPYDFALVEKGEIIQKVSASGQVIPAQKIDLQFEVQGKIQNINKEVGDWVQMGEILAVLDTTELNTQVLEAESTRDVARANFNKLLIGASPEEIRVYEVAVENAQIALANARITLKNAEQNLSDVQKVADESLRASYEDALNVLDDSYLKIYNAFNAVDSVQRAYFNGVDQVSSRVIENKNTIAGAMNRAKSYLDVAESDPQNENIDEALSEMKDALNQISGALAVIRAACEDPAYLSRVTAADKTSLDTQRSYISTAYANTVNTQQTISAAKITNETNINTAKAGLDEAKNGIATTEGNLESGEQKLAQIKAPPQQSDIDLAQAQLNQTEAAVLRARQQLEKANLITPCGAMIADIKKEEGEMARAATPDPVFSLLCAGKFQIEVDVPEVDVGKLDPQDTSEIFLDAFSEEVFQGRVLKIDPAETIIQGVVYYKVTVGFDGADDRIRSGMTADVDITTERKQDVLIIPQRAVFIKNGEKFVRVPEDSDMREIKVETGLRGINGEIEIISGLKEGDKVITFIKKK